MKIDPRRVPDVLRKPDAYRAALLYGPDEGLARERFLAIGKALLGGQSDDPFRVLDIQMRELKAEDSMALANELATLAMTGGQRVVRIRDATDRIAPLVKRALATRAPGFLLLQAGDLANGKGLRAAMEPAEGAAVIPCYPPDAQAVSAMAQARFAQEGIACDPDALAALGERLEGETGMARQSIETLALYAGPQGRLDADAVLALLGDHGAVALDEAILAALVGDRAAADHGLSRALADGMGAVGVLRIALRWMQRLQAMRIDIDRGVAPAEVVRAARPPVFWKLTAAVQSALRAADLPAIERGMLRLLEAERACKRTGAPDHLLVARALLGLAAPSRQAAR